MTRWNDDNTLHLIDTIKEAINSGKCSSHGHFKSGSKSWNEIATKLGQGYTGISCKNRWSILKRQFWIYDKIYKCAKSSPNHEISESAWTALIEADERAKNYRKTNFKFYHYMKDVMEGALNPSGQIFSVTEEEFIFSQQPVFSVPPGLTATCLQADSLDVELDHASTKTTTFGDSIRIRVDDRPQAQIISKDFIAPVEETITWLEQQATHMSDQDLAKAVNLVNLDFAIKFNAISSDLVKQRIFMGNGITFAPHFPPHFSTQQQHQEEEGAVLGEEGVVLGEEVGECVQ